MNIYLKKSKLIVLGIAFALTLIFNIFTNCARTGFDNNNFDLGYYKNIWADSSDPVINIPPKISFQDSVSRSVQSTRINNKILEYAIEEIRNENDQSDIIITPIDEKDPNVLAFRPTIGPIDKNGLPIVVNLGLSDPSATLINGRYYLTATIPHRPAYIPIWILDMNASKDQYYWKYLNYYDPNPTSASDYYCYIMGSEFVTPTSNSIHLMTFTARKVQKLHAIAFQKKKPG